MEDLIPDFRRPRSPQRNARAVSSHDLIMSLVHEQLLAQDRYELGLPESLVISVERVALHAEYEVSLRIWHVVAEHGRQRLDER